MPAVVFSPSLDFDLFVAWFHDTYLNLVTSGYQSVTPFCDIHGVCHRRRQKCSFGRWKVHKPPKNRDLETMHALEDDNNEGFFSLEKVLAKL